LTPEQQKQILAILDEAQGQYKVVHDVMDPQMRLFERRLATRLRALMTPEQKPSWKSFCASWTKNANAGGTVNSAVKLLQ